MAEAKPHQTIQLVNDLAEDIKSEPDVYMGVGLTEQDFSGMMDEVLNLATNNYPGLVIKSDLAVKIRNDKAFIAGLVNIDHPQAGHSEVDVELAFDNSIEPGKIATKDAKIDKSLSWQVKAGAKFKGIDIDAEIDRRLSDPQSSIREVMQEELLKEGVELGMLNLEFRGDKLVMGISGRPLTK